MNITTKVCMVLHSSRTTCVSSCREVENIMQRVLHVQCYFSHEHSGLKKSVQSERSSSAVMAVGPCSNLSQEEAYVQSVLEGANLFGWLLPFAPVALAVFWHR